MSTAAEMLGSGDAPAVVPPAPTGRMTDEQAMGEALISHGIMTRAQVDESFAAEARGESTAPVEDHRFAHIEEAFRPPETPAGYVLPKFADGVPYSIELDRVIRTMAHDVGLDQGLVADLVTRGNKAALRPVMTDEQRELQQATSRAELARAWGPNYEQNMKATTDFVGGIIGRHPALKILLEQNGLGDDSNVIRLFHTRALARRAG